MSENVNKKTRIDDDGIEMEWDEEKKAWFPKIDDEFILRRNLNYGFTEKENNTDSEERNPNQLVEYQEWYHKLSIEFHENCKSLGIDVTKLSHDDYTNLWNKFYNEKMNEPKKKKKRKSTGKANEPIWIDLDDNQNKHVYVENLPLDITEDEFVELMSKCGMLKFEPFEKKPKAKLYKDESSNNKGDGICTYIRIESIELALQLLDGYNYRGNVIKVSRAKFELKGNFDPKKRRRITNKEKNKLRKHEESLFRWGLEKKTIRPKNHNTVIMKNVFDVEDMKLHPEKTFDLKEKLKNALQSVGDFKSISIRELHPEGVVEIHFLNANASDVAVDYFNNKLWNSRMVTAELWDGRTRYVIKESEEDEKKRIAHWHKEIQGLVDENERILENQLQKEGDHVQSKANDATQKKVPQSYNSEEPNVESDGDHNVDGDETPDEISGSSDDD